MTTRRSLRASLVRLILGTNTLYCEQLIQDGELHCYEGDLALQAVMRLTIHTNYQEWPDGNENHLFIAKLASADAVRGRGFVPKVVLPAIEQVATNEALVGLRLNCFPDGRLMHFYKQACGFALLGQVSFDSTTTGKCMTTAKFEKALL